MGKASKWFRGLLGLKTPNSTTATSKPPPPPQQKKKWSFVKSSREKDLNRQNTTTNIQQSTTGLTTLSFNNNNDNQYHSAVVSQANKAVTDSAVAAAKAAVAVVRLTSSGRATTTVALNSSTTAYVSGDGVGYEDHEEWAAVIIQSHFRAYLSRRALGALKALVRLQAMIRGELVRRRTADVLQRMQALMRARARKANQLNYPGPATPEKLEDMMKHGENMMFRRNSLKSNGKVYNQEKASPGSTWTDSEMDVRSWEQDVSSAKTYPRESQRGDKILEVDNGKPYTVSKGRNLFHSCHPSLGGSDQYRHRFTTSKESNAHQNSLSPSSCEVKSWRFSQHDEEPYCTAENSPQFYSASSKVTPTKSDCSRTCSSGYSDHPNYMAYTESSKAKIRSLSAPKQRPNYERSISTKRYSIHGYGDSRMPVQRVSSLHANFTNKAYPGSGCLDRLEMPVREELIGFSGGHWHRY